MTERQEQMIYDEGFRRGFENGYEACRDDVAEKIAELTADRPKGEWARRNECEFRCSVCGKIIYADCENERNYCPNCGSKNRVNIFLKWDDCPKAMGADMRGADDETD